MGLAVRQFTLVIFCSGVTGRSDLGAPATPGTIDEVKAQPPIVGLKRHVDPRKVFGYLVQDRRKGLRGLWSWSAGATGVRSGGRR